MVGKNSEYLAWSGTDELLEVQEPEHPVRSEPSYNYLRQPYVRVSFPDKNYLPPGFFGQAPPKAFTFAAADSRMASDSSRHEFPLYGDPEARLRGLKLDASSCIDIVTGEQQRRVQEYLHDLIGENFRLMQNGRSFLH
jgi:hypothetical protein